MADNRKSDCYRLVSSVQIDVGEFPLHLPVPNSVNTGGYTIPSERGQSIYVYSQIDLLIAGLEADRMGYLVDNLGHFFDKFRFMMSDFDVFLAVKRDEDPIVTKSVGLWKAQILSTNNEALLQVLRRNAPLTFKWVKI
jgi:hypothetical protein